MIIRIKWKNDIMWPLLIIFMVRFYTENYQLAFILDVIWMMTMIFKNGKIAFHLPRVKGMLLFVAMIVISAYIGGLSNDVRDIVKDVFYVAQTLVIIMIGYQCYYLKKTKDVKKTLYIAGLGMAIFSVGRVILNITQITDMHSIREISSREVYEVAFILCILLADKLVMNRVIFTNTIDWVAAALMLLNVILSMGRAQIVSMFAMIVAMLIFNVLIGKNRAGRLVKLSISVAILVIISFLLYLALPQNIQDEFNDKMTVSFNEISSDEDYDGYMKAIQHWRGFEIEQAKIQWEKAPVWQKILGEGLGTYIQVKYIPSEFTEDMHRGKSIALLHNAYYTLLIKGGLLGTFSLIWLYISNIIPFFKVKNYYLKRETIVMAMITVGMMIMSYIVNGNFGFRTWIAWGIMIGWINAEIRAFKKNGVY
ncbi:hypothetical protein DWW50_08795 [Eubacterium sp. AF15-50]|uniref:O-antigen ligase family protein n=1 Tax=Eubacterium segne TaxID=2763045 RepID=A0ABR7F5H6_9FIRM|nr:MULTISPECIES: O-antigen ligase family protein [Eubacterium]MBC5668863.1 O-antigen ligase family protein [Eubacterium segne]RHR70310.1 hypothetical protein DWW68_10905 [Eubacterium sp. AF16-48]RHR78821.1 hypothetical protein DWW50_08795 [Eubacterium sp. AF15-50]